MAGYIDFYCLPVPRKNLAAYKRLSKAWGRIMRDHGMLRYTEFVEADVEPAHVTMGTRAIDKLVARRKGEVVIVSFVHFRSRAHRARVNDLAFRDPRMQKLISSKSLFDMKRMTFGEFERLVAG